MIWVIRNRMPDEDGKVGTYVLDAPSGELAREYAAVSMDDMDILSNDFYECTSYESLQAAIEAIRTYHYIVDAEFGDADKKLLN